MDIFDGPFDGPYDLPENGDDLSDDLLKPIKMFLEAGFKDGQPIKKSWFHDALGIPEPKPTMQFSEAQGLQLEFLKKFERFRLRILHEANIVLKTEYGSGCYSILPAKDQVAWSQTRFEKDLATSFKKAIDRVTFLRVDELTPQERAEAVNAAAVVATLKTHMNAAKASAKRRKSVFN